MKTQKTQFENRTRTQISNEDWAVVTSKLTQDENGFTHSSVNKRLRKTIANRANGAKGGRPPKPKEPKTETQNNPPLEREGESEKEREVEEAKPTSPPLNDSQFVSIAECRKTYDQSCQAQKQAIQISKGLSNEQIAELQNDFDNFMLSKSSKKVFSDYRSHFANWINKNPDKIKLIKSPKKNNQYAQYGF